MHKNWSIKLLITVSLLLLGSSWAIVSDATILNNYIKFRLMQCTPKPEFTIEKTLSSVAGISQANTCIYAE